jgi:selenocysteine lyase/cysteine desulfurase
MPYTRRALLKSLPRVVGLSALRTAHTGGSRDSLGVRADFPVADSVLFLNSAYITPTPAPAVAAGREFAEAKGSAPIALGDMLKKTDAVRAQYARLIHASPDEIRSM